LIADGGVQWMTAGRGIIHSEMPRQQPGLDLWGLQLWVNLPAARKLSRPRYQDLSPSSVPEIAVGGARARLIAGAFDGRRGPVEGIVTEPTMLDATLPAGEELRLALPGAHTAFVYALDGELAVGAAGTRVPAGSIAALGPGSVFAATGGGRFLLLAAAPIGEPVARRGPFVMNTEAELDQAVADYRSGRLVDG
jgi:redox-sensitive bicupin YhaK (pirin superfamily)